MGLSVEMDALSGDLGELATLQKETAKLRDEEKGANMRTLSQCKEGLKAVTEAMEILKAFYKNAAKASSLVQVHASPVDEHSPGAGFDTTYTGKQAESKG